MRASTRDRAGPGAGGGPQKPEVVVLGPLGPRRRMQMIDLHTHVLPGIDDGPDTIDQSLELMRAAAEQGTTLMAATPHLRSDHPLVKPGELAAACADVNGRVPAGLDISVVPAGEVDLTWAQH